MKPFLTAAFALLTLATLAQPGIQKKIQTQLILADDGSTLALDAGTFQLMGSLSLEGKKNVTIRGQGQDKTILSFKGQTDGAEGLRVTNAEHIVIENLTIQDTKGDAIKTMHVKGITFRNVKVEWTGPPNPTNGSYGLYPVECDEVLIENCTAIGASDAGIYVGQSRNIVVRKSKAFHNVAGIEIENSLNADVHDNEATQNTGGILVFDLPDLIQKRGGNIRVFDNVIRDNNFPNFAPKGNIVAKVADGTGVLILATNHVELFHNQIINNRSIGTGIISYFFTENPIKDPDYYPYPTAIFIHDNTYQREHVRPTSAGRMGKMFRFKLRFGKDVPDIIYDGIVDEKTLGPDRRVQPESRLCLRNNANARFVNLDAEHDFKHLSRDASPHDCSLEALKMARLNQP